MERLKKISGALCYLAPPVLEDAEKWAAWLNDIEITLPLGDEAYLCLSVERVREDIQQAVQSGENVFTIVDNQTDLPIGRCLIFGRDGVNRSAMIGIFIGEKHYWGKGYGQEATRLLLDYAFNLLNLHSVMLGTFSFNERAMHAYRRVGFKEIGRRREARIIAGKKYDVILMDILEDEFREACGKSALVNLD
jgi:RimJ/RimL family protein N-acetyltransferase